MIDIALTVDVEWCPPAVIEWLVTELGNAAVTATFFATDHPHLDLDGHEVGIHPNPFRVGATGMVAEVGRLKDLFPRAVGLRMHRLAWESGLEKPVAEMGIRYASTQLLPRTLVAPMRLSPHLVHFPIFYMDHHELINGEQFQPPFSLAALEMSQGGLYVFDFHPNMLFTNAPNETFYREHVHAHYDDPDALRLMRHPGRGCFSLFSELLKLRGCQDVRFITLSEAYDAVTRVRAKRLEQGAGGPA